MSEFSDVPDFLQTSDWRRSKGGEEAAVMLALIDGPIVFALIVGGACIGLRGLFNIDILSIVLGHTGAKIAQTLVGLSAIWMLFRHKFV